MDGSSRRYEIEQTTRLDIKLLRTVGAGAIRYHLGARASMQRDNISRKRLESGT